MLTLIVIALFAGIFLTHIFADVLKAAAVVALVVCAIYFVRDVSFRALVDEGAHALYDAVGDQPCERPAPRRYAGRRI